MRQTNDQQTATEALRTQAGPYRVTLDPEGWPRIEGRYGQIEHHDGALLAVDSQAVRKLARSSRSGLVATRSGMRSTASSSTLRFWGTSHG